MTRTLAITVLCLLTLTVSSHARQQSDDRPNFLVITVEDMSPDLGCYGDPNARTPRIDALASDGIRYTSAYANAPVCSPARTALFFSRYQHSLGGSNHRSRATIPMGVRGFAAELRDAGYFTTNHAKLDVNVQNSGELSRDAYDAGEGWWEPDRNGRPFLSIINIDTTHQSRTSVWPRARYERSIRALLSPDEIADPAEVVVPPYYPDTPAVRRELARYADCITLMDRQTGAILDRLERDGLKDNTIVLYFSDHGAGHAAHKRSALARGARVPLIIRFPERWQHLAPVARGSTDDRLVAFIDIGPTILQAAGVPIPKSMHGQPFLDDHPDKELVFIARDRLDEDLDHSRMVTDGRYVYTRHYFPSRPLWSRSSYTSSSPIYQEIDGLDTALVTEPRGAETLFDLHTDPFEINNLADHPDHTARQNTFRAALREHQRAIHDVGLIPEGIAAQHFGNRPPALVRAEYIHEMLDLADAVGKGVSAADSQRAGLESKNAAARFWAVVGIGEQTSIAPSTTERLREIMLHDLSATVRAAAAGVLYRRSQSIDEAQQALVQAVESPGYFDALYAARESQLLGFVDDDFFAALSRAAAKWNRYELNSIRNSVQRIRRGEDRPFVLR
ncbi:MAG: sulfatase [Planctomycetota bacterium]